MNQAALAARLEELRTETAAAQRAAHEAYDTFAEIEARVKKEKRELMKEICAETTTVKDGKGADKTVKAFPNDDEREAEYERRRDPALAEQHAAAEAEKRRTSNALDVVLEQLKTDRVLVSHATSENEVEAAKIRAGAVATFAKWEADGATERINGPRRQAPARKPVANLDDELPF
jgi:hypothetical protein